MDHGDHGNGSNNFRCSMKMLFNWDTTNLCIVFSWWKVDGILLLLLSCFFVALIGVAYEALRNLARKYDEKICEASYLQINGAEEDNPPVVRVKRIVSIVVGTAVGFFFFGKQTVSSLEEDDRIINCH
ncbi:1743_t:CDS:2 [Scutellospora calospora]|uniref:1743_t:CDS:1 n=1 Tax=Scutellospora calospora TaxID=85575 RepID=A0ACA9JU62_9GLOM|nr:1743_t:CDS:2 [Scutellospora calospora]